MKDCIFCKIINGEIPCYKIYEDDFVLAFLDISNDAYGHTLVVPKKHYETIMTCDNSTLAKVMQVVKKIGNHYIDNCGFDGVNILNNNGEAANQSVKHLHIHIIPRKKDDKMIVSNFFCGKVLSSDAKNLTICPFEEGGNLEEICQTLKISDTQDVVLDGQNAVVLYSDGACSGNPGAGGWATILSYKGKEKVLSGGEKETTNNRMELMAVIQGLESIKSNLPVQVFSDSAYVVNAFEKKWLEFWRSNNWKTASKGEVQNKDLWQRLLALTEKLDVKFNKVKGHSDNVYNNRCDALAREEIAKLQN